jgi:hypothetical protein
MPLADRNAGLQQKGADLVDGRVCWLADAPSRTWLAALGARLRMPKHSRGAKEKLDSISKRGDRYRRGLFTVVRRP